MVSPSVLASRRRCQNALRPFGAISDELTPTSARRIVLRSPSTACARSSVHTGSEPATYKTRDGSPHHLIGTQQQVFRDRKTELACHAQVDDQLVSGKLF